MAAQRAERDDPPDGSKKGALMAERDDPPDGSKKNGGHNKIKKPLTGAGWGKMMEGGGSHERFCYSSFVKIFYQL